MNETNGIARFQADNRNKTFLFHKLSFVDHPSFSCCCLIFSVRTRHVVCNYFLWKSMLCIESQLLPMRSLKLVEIQVYVSLNSILWCAVGINRNNAVPFRSCIIMHSYDEFILYTVEMDLLLDEITTATTLILIKKLLKLLKILNTEKRLFK